MQLALLGQFNFEATVQTLVPHKAAKVMQGHLQSQPLFGDHRQGCGVPLIVLQQLRSADGQTKTQPLHQASALLIFSNRSRDSAGKAINCCSRALISSWRASSSREN